MDENMTWWLPLWQSVLPRKHSKGQVYWATSNSRTRNLASKELPLEAFSFIVFFHPCPPYQPLPQIPLSWAKILN